MRLNLGAGSRAEKEFVNVDSYLQPGIDIVHDLDVFPWPWPDNSVSYIKAFDVYEHVEYPLEFMAECHRILEPRGTLYIHTAHWKNQSSFNDPTHKRFLTENSFDYWIPGTSLNERYGAAYARGHHFSLGKIHRDLPGAGDLNVFLMKI